MCVSQETLQEYEYQKCLLFLSGDWIVNYHGSWSQEKAYVTGLDPDNQPHSERFGQKCLARFLVTLELIKLNS
jgi:hypothetical protein